MPGLTASVKMNGYNLIIPTLKNQGMNYLTVNSYTELMRPVEVQGW
jgi:hypothetical protein